MDEFNELDKELERLKVEFTLNDVTAKKSQMPDYEGYWKRRMEEEKILWSKRVQGKDEEKKSLEERLKQQQSIIDEYNGKIEEIEKKVQYETLAWEQKLKAKEADLLIERNRLLNEEKVRNMDIENKKLLGQIADLNEKIVLLKEEQKNEVDRLNRSFKNEKDVYEEKVATVHKQIEILEARIAENADLLKEKEGSSSTTEHDLRTRMAAITSEISKHVKEKEKAEIERQTLLVELQDVKAKAEEEKKNLQAAIRESTIAFLSDLKQHSGPLSGLLRFAKENNAKKSIWKAISQTAQNLENQIENYETTASIKPPHKRPVKIASLLPERDMQILGGMIAVLPHEIAIISKKKLEKDIMNAKPQIVVLPPKYVKLSARIKKEWPFLDVFVFGEADHKVAKKAAKLHVAALVPPYSQEVIYSAVSKAVYSTVAWPEYWKELKVKKSGPIYLLFILLLGIFAAGGYTQKDRLMDTIRKYAVHQTVFTTPYPQPTGIATDGKSVWACDWYGQSVYQHNVEKNMEISKIFYFPGKRFSALCFASGYVWTADPWEKKIYRHNLDDTLSIVEAFNSPNSAPSGLAGDGKYLWSCDAVRGEIYRHAIDKELTIEAAFKCPGLNPSGLYYDGASLWSVDSKTNKIYKHKMDETLSVESVYIPPEYGERGANLSGIAGSGGNIWICSEKAGKIYKYPVKTLAKVAE